MCAIARLVEGFKITTPVAMGIASQKKRIIADLIGKMGRQSNSEIWVRVASSLHQAMHRECIRPILVFC